MEGPFCPVFVGPWVRRRASCNVHVFPCSDQQRRGRQVSTPGMTSVDGSDPPRARAKINESSCAPTNVPVVIPAKAGTRLHAWVPAFAG
jgi:hypothetical protein